MLLFYWCIVKNVYIYVYMYVFILSVCMYIYVINGARQVGLGGSESEGLRTLTWCGIAVLLLLLRGVSHGHHGVTRVLRRHTPHAHAHAHVHRWVRVGSAIHVRIRVRVHPSLHLHHGSLVVRSSHHGLLLQHAAKKIFFTTNIKN